MIGSGGGAIPPVGITSTIVIPWHAICLVKKEFSKKTIVFLVLKSISFTSLPFFFLVLIFWFPWEGVHGNLEFGREVDKV
jgi:hypothetical protein